MTAFTCNSGGVENWDSKSGGSVNATLDSYAISNGTTLLIDTPPDVALCIYMLTNMVNGKRYVGQTRGLLKNRIRQHVRGNGRRHAIHDAIIKYGASAFRVNVLQAVAAAEDLNAAEAAWIKAIGSMAPTGYNITHGGNSEAKTLEQRSKQSASMKLAWEKNRDNYIKAIRSACCKVVHAEKISRAKRGVPAKQSTTDAMVVTKMAGRRVCCENGQTYTSFVEAAATTGLSRQAIWRCAHGKSKTCGGLRFWIEVKQ